MYFLAKSINTSFLNKRLKRQNDITANTIYAIIPTAKDISIEQRAFLNGIKVLVATTHLSKFFKIPL